MAVKQITLRAWSDNSDVAPVKINQGDILSRTVIIMLVDSGGTPIDLALSSVRVHFSKPDNTVAYLTASIVNATAGIISVTLDSQCTAVPGAVKSIVQVTGPNGENLLFIGPVFAVSAISIEGSIISSNEFTALTDALKQVQGIANKADLNADGKVIQDPASYGQKADLNADGKVIQDPASYGQVGGAALISKLPQSPQLVMLHPDGTLSTAGGLPQSDDGSTLKHYMKFANGLMIEWGVVTATVSITQTYGSMFHNNDYVTLLHSFVSDVSGTVSLRSTGIINAFGTYYEPSTHRLCFTMVSPLSVSNLSVNEIYTAVGYWKLPVVG